eukprot:Platyproteum_vivax@DN17158_c0_g1_i1.p1
MIEDNEAVDLATSALDCLAPWFASPTHLANWMTIPYCYCVWKVLASFAILVPNTSPAGQQALNCLLAFCQLATETHTQHCLILVQWVAKAAVFATKGPRAQALVYLQDYLTNYYDVLTVSTDWLTVSRQLLLPLLTFEFPVAEHSFTDHNSSNTSSDSDCCEVAYARLDEDEIAARKATGAGIACRVVLQQTEKMSEVGLLGPFMVEVCGAIVAAAEKVPWAVQVTFEENLRNLMLVMGTFPEANSATVEVEGTQQSAVVVAWQRISLQFPHLQEECRIAINGEKEMEKDEKETTVQISEAVDNLENANQTSVSKIGENQENLGVSNGEIDSTKDSTKAELNPSPSSSNTETEEKEKNTTSNSNRKDSDTSSNDSYKGQNTKAELPAPIFQPYRFPLWGEPRNR